MLFILIEKVQSFPHDNSLSNVATILDSVEQKSELECKVAIKWFYKNKAIVDPGKLQAILLDKHKSNNTEARFLIGVEEIQAILLVEILGITIDDKLKFNLRNDKICPKSPDKFDALIRLKCFFR